MYVDNDFAGNWKKDESDDQDKVQSRHQYFIMYLLMGHAKYARMCFWHSILQEPYDLK